MTITNALTQTLLVACDQSYWGGPDSNTPSPYGAITNGTALAPYLDSGQDDAGLNLMPSSWNQIGLSNWTVKQRYDDPKTGFGATVYKKDNGNGTFDYIVAMQGTRGPNIQDWGGNLIYAWDKWGGDVAQGMVGDLLNLDPSSVNQINFTGQSLGGALAQYAAYNYAVRLNQQHLEDSTKPAFDPSKITLTTFNGLGGVAGLSQNVSQLLGEPFNAHLLDNVTTAYYYTTNDLVHSLGDGNLNGSAHEYRLDFPKLDVSTNSEGELVKLPDGSLAAPDFIDAHRIESGFYRGFNFAEQNSGYGFPVDFSQAIPQAVDWLHIGNLARVGTYIAWLSNQDNALTTGAEAWSRAIAALTVSTAFGDQHELRMLTDALMDSLYAADEIHSARVRDLLKQNFPKFAHAMALSPSGQSTVIAAQMLALAVEAGGTSTNVDVPSGFGERLIALINGAGLLTATPTLSPLGIADGTLTVLANHNGQSKAHVLYTGLAVLESVTALLALPASVLGAAQATLISDLLALGASASVDVATFTQKLLTTTAQALGQTILTDTDAFRRVMTIVANANVLAAQEVAREATALAIDSVTFVQEIEQAIAAGLNTVAHSIANAYDDVTKKAGDAVDLGVEVTRGVLDTLIHGVQSTAELASDGVHWIFDKALNTLESADQYPIIEPLSVMSINPFDDPNFDPTTASTSRSEIQGNGINTYVLYLPYAAGDGGQKIQIRLSGNNAGLKVQVGDEIITPTDGSFDLTVSAGTKVPLSVSAGLLACHHSDYKPSNLLRAA